MQELVGQRLAPIAGHFTEAIVVERIEDLGGYWEIHGRTLNGGVREALIADLELQAALSQGQPESWGFEQVRLRRLISAVGLGEGALDERGPHQVVGQEQDAGGPRPLTPPPIPVESNEYRLVVRAEEGVGTRPFGELDREQLREALEQAGVDIQVS
ncbi:MAG: hypothetical protein H6741_00770 [Alphaproteobacteria bacterium]|nr:hypothetical protein [Alphaproteobacteria bacterium]MCB9791234.1 hypothetical protein [Alphaproteobacteria bacterium]